MVLRRLCVAACLAAVPAHAGNPLDFARDVLPILERSCLPCHNATKSEADLMLETPQLMLKGGEKGPAIKPNHGMESLLYLTAARLKKPFMPPAENKSKAQPLTSQQLEIIRRWIDEGATGRGRVKEPVHWQPMPAVARISATAITRDGAFAAASRGNRVTLYDLSLKQAVAELPADAHHDLVNAVAFSPDGSLLATGSYGEVKLWKLVTLQISPSLAKLPGLAALDCLSPDGKMKASVATLGEAVITTADGKKVLGTLKADSDQARKIGEATLQQQAAVFEVAYLKSTQQKAVDALKKFEDAAKKAETDNADFIKRTADIKKAVVDAGRERDQKQKDKDTADAELTAAMQAKEKADKEADSAQLALDRAAGAPDKKGKADAAKVLTSAKGSADAAGKALAKAQKKLETCITSANKAQTALNEAQSETGKVADAALTARKAAADLAKGRAEVESGKKLAVEAQASLDKTNKSLEDLRKAAPPPGNAVRSIAFTADGRFVITTHEDGCARGWLAPTGDARWTRRIDKQPLGAVALQGGVMLVAKASRETVALDVAPRLELVRTIGDSTKVDSPLTDRVNALAFSPDGKVLATGSGDPSRSGQIKLWDLASGRMLREFAKPHKDAVLALDFSSDGRLLASGAADRAVRLWEVATGRQLRNLEAHGGHVLAVSLRNDGRMLASAGADNAVRVWSLITGDVITTVSLFKKEVTSIHYAEQRDLLAATAGDPQVRLFTDDGAKVGSDETTFKSYLTAGCVTPDGRLELAGDAAGTLWVLGGGDKVHVLASFEAPK